MCRSVIKLQLPQYTLPDTSLRSGCRPLWRHVLCVRKLYIAAYGRPRKKIEDDQKVSCKETLDPQQHMGMRTIMNRVLCALVVILMGCAFCPVSAQSPNDERQIRSIAASWEKAWNKHDMKALFLSFTSDADFVNVAGRHWKGRQEIEAQHTTRLSQFIKSTYATKAVTVQFLKPDVALVHVDWRITGDTDPDGTARKPRDGVFLWIVVKQWGRWQVRAAQNTNVNNPPIISK